MTGFDVRRPRSKRASLLSHAALAALVTCSFDTAAFAQVGPATPVTNPVAATTGPAPGEAATPQETDETATADIVVTGVRASLEDALQNKRRSGDVIDSISSEGIGRLPDLNLAESLQRVPGVQINRSAPRRLGTVSIRGLPGGFAQTTINGQYLANPDVSSFSYGAVRSEVFSGIDIIKAGSSRNLTGGLSGIVNLRTGNPLDAANAFVVSVDGGYEEATRKVVPGGAIVFSRQLIPGTLAVRAAVGLKSVDFREDNVQINTYERIAGAATADTSDDVLTPQQLRLATNRVTGDAKTASLGLAWTPTNTLTATFDGFYNIYTPSAYSSQYAINSTASSLRTATGDADAQGVFGSTQPSIRIVDPTILADSRFFDDRFETQAYTTKLRWAKDDWAAEATVHYTTADRSRITTGYQAQQASLAGTASNGFVVDFNTGSGDIRRVSYDLVSDNPLFVNLGQAFGSPIAPTYREVRATGTTGASFIGGNRTDNESEDELAFQLDLTRTLDLGPISSIGIGGIYRDKSQRQTQSLDTLFGANVSTLNNSFYVRDFSVQNGGESFFGGKIGGFNSQDYIELDVRGLTDALRPTTTPAVPNASYFVGPSGLVTFLDSTALSATYENSQKIYGGYGIVNLNEEIGERIRLTGNLGLRYEKSERATQAQRLPTVYNFEYENVLPSGNLTFELDNRFILRTAYSKTLRRPQVDEFAVLRSIAVDGTGTLVSVGLGATDLRPFTSKNLDVSLEWYNRRGSSVSALFFRKTVEDYAGTTRICPADGGGFGFGPLSTSSGVCRATQATPAQGTFRDVSAGAVVNINVTANQDAFTLTGYELSAQQNLDFLPAPFNGLGGSVNYTHISFDTDGTFRLSELSKHTINGILYYETKRFGVRAAYVYRSGYFLGSGGTQTGADRLVDDRGQLDLSGTLNVSDRFTLTAEAFNVTDRNLYEYEGVKSRARNYTRYGRTYSMGVRYRF